MVTVMICRLVSLVRTSSEELVGEQSLEDGISLLLIFVFEPDNELDPLESVDTLPSCRLAESLRERTHSS